ncbi:MAG: DUF1501 domain-containing protein [Pirellulaceae bacterium]
MANLVELPILTRTQDETTGHQATAESLSGGGVRGGQVIGKSDKHAGHPETTPYHPNDIGATVYSTLGVDPASIIRDRENRPLHLNNGKVMEKLYTG